MNVIRCQHRSAARLFFGWCALVLFVGTASPLGMGLAALLGSFDPNHHALVQTEGESTRLVLHHEQECAGHHHGVVARTLTLFAQAPSAGQSDHVLQFSTAKPIAQRTQLSAPSPAQSDQPALGAGASPAGLGREDFLSIATTIPPPGASGQLLCLRSTVLLI